MKRRQKIDSSPSTLRRLNKALDVPWKRSWHVGHIPATKKQVALGQGFTEPLDSSSFSFVSFNFS